MPAELDHMLFVGQTKFGKSTAAKTLAKMYKEKGIKIIVYDPYGKFDENHQEIPSDKSWGADWITNDLNEFLIFVMDPQQCVQCALFVDEAAASDPQKRWDIRDAKFNWLTTSARHHGHVSHIITWNGTDITPTMRRNCNRICIFNIGYEYARELRKDFNAPMIEEASKLPKGHYIYAERGGQFQKRGKVWWAK